MHIRRDDPEAYLLTWTAYGTWLHGNDRGSVDDEHNIVGAPSAPIDASREAVSRRAMAHSAIHLTNAMRSIVEQTIADHCRVKKWSLHAVNVRTTHVHAVVDCGSFDSDVAMEQLKAWSTRRVRDAGLIDKDRPLWTRRGSNRYCWTPEHVAKAVDYVMRLQGEDLHSRP